MLIDTVEVFHMPLDAIPCPLSSSQGSHQTLSSEANWAGNPGVPAPREWSRENGLRVGITLGPVAGGAGRGSPMEPPKEQHLSCPDVDLTSYHSFCPRFNPFNT